MRSRSVLVAPRKEGRGASRRAGLAELTAASVRAGLASVRARISGAGGDPDHVRIIAVTKGFGPEAVNAAVGAGCTDIGENYAQELLAKADAIGLAEATVHFLGGVQRNKISKIAAKVDVWQSVDRVDVGAAIQRHAPGARVLLQVDLLEGAHPGRRGVAIDRAADLAGDLERLGMTVEGVMAVGPPPPADPEPGFRRVAALARELELAEISIGMSGDIEAAVRAGSTMVRVGTALFGPRPSRPKT